MNRGIPNSSRLLATPANSAMTLPKFVDDQHRHQEERDPEAELLPDQIAQPFARDRTHARGHLLHDDEGDGGGNHRPQQRIAELRPGDGVRPDPPGVVAALAGDQPGTDDGDEERQPALPAFSKELHGAASV